MKNIFLIAALATLAVIPLGNVSYSFKAPAEKSCETAQFFLCAAKDDSHTTNKGLVAEAKVSLSKITKINLGNYMSFDLGFDLKPFQDYPAIQALGTVIKSISDLFDGRKCSSPNYWTSRFMEVNDKGSCRKNVIAHVCHSVFTLPVRL